MSKCICDSCKYLLSCELEPKENQCELFKSYNELEKLTDTITGESDEFY